MHFPDDTQVTKLFVWLLMVGILNAMVFIIVSGLHMSRDRMRLTLSVLNAMIFLVNYCYGAAGFGKDWPSFVPPLLFVLFWLAILAPKPPKRRRRRRRVQVEKKRVAVAPGYHRPPGVPA